MAKKTPRPAKTLQAYTHTTLPRSALEPHPLNPRYIDPPARRKLWKSLKRHGLVEPIIVNHRAPPHWPDDSDPAHVIVGGHQRINVADEIYSFDPDDPATDYEVPVALLSCPEAEEAALIISLNNPALQGSYDLSILEELLTTIHETGGDVRDTGFDRLDLARILDQGIADGLFGHEAAQQAAAESPLIDQLAAMKETSRQFEKERKSQAAGDEPAAGPDSDDADGGPHKAPAATEQDRNSRESLIARRHEYVEKKADEVRTEFLLIFVADHARQLAAFLQDAGWETPDGYLPLYELAEKLGMPLVE